MAWADCDPNLCAFECLAPLEVEQRGLERCQGDLGGHSTTCTQQLQEGHFWGRGGDGELWPWTHMLKDAAPATLSSGMVPTTQAATSSPRNSTAISSLKGPAGWCQLCWHLPAPA